MAEKAEKKSEGKEGGAAAPAAHGSDDKKGAAKGGFLKSTPAIIGGAMLLEAIVLIGGFKVVGGGGAKVVQGAELVNAATEAGKDGDSGATGSKTDKKKTVELPLAAIKATNSRRGRTVLYDVHVFIQAKAEDEDELKEILQDHDAEIRDKIRTIVAESDPDKLGGGSEPGLETLRRQIKFQLDEIVGEGKIEEVLVTDCTPIRTDL